MEKSTQDLASEMVRAWLATENGSGCVVSGLSVDKEESWREMGKRIGAMVAGIVSATRVM